MSFFSCKRSFGPASGVVFLTLMPLYADDPSRLDLVQTIALQGKAGRLDHLTLDAKGRRLFIANLSNNSLDVVDLKAGKPLSVVDAKTLEVLAKVPLPGPPEAFQLDTAAGRIFLNSPSPAQVVVIDLRKNAVTASHPLQRARKNYPLALDAAGRRVCV